MNASRLSQRSLTTRDKTELPYNRKLLVSIIQMWHNNRNDLSKVKLVAHRCWFRLLWWLALVLCINTTTAMNAAPNAIENQGACCFKMLTNATMDGGSNDTESRDIHKLEKNIKELLGKAFLLMKKAGRETDAVNFFDLAEATSELSHETADVQKTIIQNTYRNLKARYDDLAVANFIAAAKTRHDIAAELERCQLDDWASQGLQLERILSLLKINAVDGNALNKRLLLTCLAYAKKINIGPSTDVKLLYDSLRERLTDLDFANMVAQLDIDDHSIVNELALALREMLLDEWRIVEPVDLFRRLFENVDVDEIFNTPAIHIWIYLALSFQREIRDIHPYQILYLQMREYKHAEDSDIARIVAAPQKNADTRVFALGLENELLLDWTRRKVKHEAVFQILGLKKLKEEDVVLSPHCETWFRFYMSTEKVPFAIKRFGMLNLELTDAEFLILFAVTKRDVEFEDKLFLIAEKFLLSKKIDPVDLFYFFDLNLVGFKLFESLFFKFWAKFVKSVCHPDLNPAEEMINIMENANYSIDYLEEIIGRVIYTPSHELESSIPLSRNAEFAPELWAVVEAKQKTKKKRLVTLSEA
ncbi:hypothetical protein CCR75_007057 [Bremia lactucae]|uniref:Uncharacterized protein n=1 Tax=Bremia lactucae TaxID=4779 RepID=A0A976FPR1_BRELC|nr:hypothetical protein CCR75_007057 [Bremia lactucae]